jgi:hypothetical protein
VIFEEGLDQRRNLELVQGKVRRSCPMAGGSGNPIR